jgi:hypothetical protein
LVIQEITSLKKSTVVDLKSFSQDESQWNPTLSTNVKPNQNIILKIAPSTPILHDKFDSCEASPLTPFSKIIKSFETVKDSLGKSVPISEGVSYSCFIFIVCVIILFYLGGRE